MTRMLVVQYYKRCQKIIPIVPQKLNYAANLTGMRSVYYISYEMELFGNSYSCIPPKQQILLFYKILDNNLIFYMTAYIIKSSLTDSYILNMECRFAPRLCSIVIHSYSPFTLRKTKRYQQSNGQGERKSNTSHLKAYANVV